MLFFNFLDYIDRSNTYCYLTRKNDMKALKIAERLFLFFVKKAVIDPKRFFATNQSGKKPEEKLKQNGPLKLGAVSKVYKNGFCKLKYLHNLAWILLQFRKCSFKNVRFCRLLKFG